MVNGEIKESYYFFHEMERTWFTIMNCQVEGQNDHDSGQSNRPANKKHGHDTEGSCQQA